MGGAVELHNLTDGIRMGYLRIGKRAFRNEHIRTDSLKRLACVIRLGFIITGIKVSDAQILHENLGRSEYMSCGDQPDPDASQLKELMIARRNVALNRLLRVTVVHERGGRRRTVYLMVPRCSMIRMRMGYHGMGHRMKGVDKEISISAIIPFRPLDEEIRKYLHHFSLL